MIEVNRKASFNCNKETIWNIVTNNKEYAWRSNLAKIEVIEDNHFIEQDKNGFQTQFTITKKEPFDRYEFDIKNANLTGHWIGAFLEIEGKTQIDFTEQVEVKGILMKLLAKPYLKAQQAKYIQDLAKAIEEKESIHDNK